MVDKLEQDDSQVVRACVVEHRRGLSACRWMVLAEEVAAVTERHTVEAAWEQVAFDAQASRSEEPATGRSSCPVAREACDEVSWVTGQSSGVVMSDSVKLQESAWYADTVGYTETDGRRAANAGMATAVGQGLERVEVEGVEMVVGSDWESD